MMTLLIPLIAGAVAWALFFAGLKLVRLYALSHERYVEAARRFYETADRILSNPDAPAQSVEFIAELNETINRKETAAVIAYLLRRKRVPDQAPVSSKAPGPSFTEDPLLTVAFYHWFMAVTSRSPYFGWITRLTIGDRAVKQSIHQIAETTLRRNPAHA